MALNEMSARIEAEKKAKEDAKKLADKIAADKTARGGRKVEPTKTSKAREDALKKRQNLVIEQRKKAPLGSKPAAPKPMGTPGSGTGMGAFFQPKSEKIIAQYTVKKGDTLSQIAKDHYGSGSQPYYKLIQEANKDLIKDANLIYPGQVFKIPELPDELKKK